MAKTVYKCTVRNEIRRLKAYAKTMQGKVGKKRMQAIMDEIAANENLYLRLRNGAEKVREIRIK